jgi:hypothetical protein
MSRLSKRIANQHKRQATTCTMHAVLQATDCCIAHPRLDMFVCKATFATVCASAQGLTLSFVPALPSLAGLPLLPPLPLLLPPILLLPCPLPLLKLLPLLPPAPLELSL